VLAAASIGEAAVKSILVGSDLCLVCHHEDSVLQAHEAMVQACEQDSAFARRTGAAALRVLAFKKKWAKILRPQKAPSAATAEKLTRKLWEFGEQVRLETLEREEHSRRPRR